MQSRTVLVIVAIALCATLALGTDSRTIGRPGGGLGVPADTLDVAVEIERPDTLEVPEVVMPVVVRLTNMSDTSGMVDSLQVTISGGYYSFVTGMPKLPGESKLTYMPDFWVCPAGSEETCTAWITCPADSNHANDTDVVIVNRGSGLSERARTDVSKSPGWLNGSIARTTCFVSHTEPLNVTLFDIKGRAVVASRLGAARAGKSSLDLRGLRSGVYLVRLDDGRRSSFQKLVVQR